MPDQPDDELLSLVHRWTTRFGYHDGRIDLEVDDLATFTVPDATLTAHAPLWGTREGEERAVPVADVRRQLARMLRWFRVTRHDMQLARHPDGERLCLFFVLKGRFFLLPFTLRTVPLAFVVTATRTGEGLRIRAIDEWAAGSAAEAREVLIERCGWPKGTAFAPHVAFGAVC